MDLLYYINKSGTTVIVITHSQEIAKSSGMRIVTMDRGVIAGDTGSVGER